MTYNPQPKDKPIRLKGDAYHRLRWDAFYRAAGCCEICGMYAPFDSKDQINGELWHEKHRSSGGSDVLENVLWSCIWCHEKKHRGNLKKEGK